MKTCTKCQIPQPLENFSKHKRSKDGLQPNCKSCVSIYKKQYFKDNKERLAEKSKQYYKDNAVSIITKVCQRQSNNRASRNEYIKLWRSGERGSRGIFNIKSKNLRNHAKKQGDVTTL